MARTNRRVLAAIALVATLAMAGGGGEFGAGRERERREREREREGRERPASRGFDRNCQTEFTAAFAALPVLSSPVTSRASPSCARSLLFLGASLTNTARENGREQNRVFKLGFSDRPFFAHQAPFLLPPSFSQNKHCPTAVHASTKKAESTMR